MRAWSRPKNLSLPGLLSDEGGGGGTTPAGVIQGHLGAERCDDLQGSRSMPTPHRQRVTPDHNAPVWSDRRGNQGRVPAMSPWHAWLSVQHVVWYEVYWEACCLQRCPAHKSSPTPAQKFPYPSTKVPLPQHKSSPTPAQKFPYPNSRNCQKPALFVKWLRYPDVASKPDLASAAESQLSPKKVSGEQKVNFLWNTSGQQKVNFSWNRHPDSKMSTFSNTDVRTVKSQLSLERGSGQQKFNFLWNRRPDNGKSTFPRNELSTLTN
ncbi:hypothetical protein RRG08_059171 [Elysia crispata]|uniref:Uncharacterized protein n=1 Tax=Elysia crispata TaxID=231223 RepID=A0AAE1E8E7_9GAST|nr:hypothetical protein RRG08_059171 [Elysia crispata]